MSFVIIIGLVVAVISLSWMVVNLDNKLREYEEESIKKTRKDSDVTK